MAHAMKETELHTPSFQVRPNKSWQTRETFKISALTAGDVSHVSTPSGSTRLLNRFLKPDLYDK
jgi:hypothetical protein